MGPVVEILIERDDAEMLDALDAALAGIAQRIDRTRKGRVWDVWIDGCPIHVCVEGPPPTVLLAARVNQVDSLQRLSDHVAQALRGLASNLQW